MKHPFPFCLLFVLQLQPRGESDTPFIAGNIISCSGSNGEKHFCHLRLKRETSLLAAESIFEQLLVLLCKENKVLSFEHMNNSNYLLFKL